MDSDIDGADDSHSDGADDAFAAEPNKGARSPVTSPGGGAGGIDSDSDDGAKPNSRSDFVDDGVRARASKQ